MRDIGCESNARETAKQDLVAEQIWGVLVASAREGVTSPIVIAHAAARNVLTALAKEASA